MDAVRCVSETWRCGTERFALRPHSELGGGVLSTSFESDSVKSAGIVDRELFCGGDGDPRSELHDDSDSESLSLSSSSSSSSSSSFSSSSSTAAAVGKIC